MSNVIEANFTDQVVHICRPKDDEQLPVCGADPEAAFVAEPNGKLRDGFRWCGACLKREAK